jgi:transcriptional regulator with XRE-family HTH domain
VYNEENKKTERNMAMATFSQRVKEMRLSMNLSLRQLSKLTDISPSAIHSYEMGIRMAKLDALEALSDVFNCDIKYLIGESDIKNQAAYELGYSSLYEAYSETGSTDIPQSQFKTKFRLDHFNGAADPQPFGNSEQLPEKEKKLLALYNKIEDKEGLIRFIERLSALSAEQQKFVFDNLLQGQ